MSAVDWADQSREDVIEVRMVSPTDLDCELGTLDGIDLSASSIEAGYYNRHRTQGKIRVDGGGWERGSFLRVYHRVPAWGYERELGTYLVRDDPAERRHGRWMADLDLRSMLFAMSEDRPGTPKTVAAGASAKAAMLSIFSDARRPHVDLSARDARLSDARVFESGTAQLERLYALAEVAGDRPDVDGHGRVTLSPYVAPSERTPAHEIVLDSPRGIAADGIGRSADALSMPNRAIVSHRWHDEDDSRSEREIVEHADATDGRSWRTRGYVVADYFEVDELSPRDAATAQRLARERLAHEGVEHVEWEIRRCMLLPIWEGDVVWLTLPDGEAGNEAYGGRRKCLVKSVTIELKDMSMGLVLKEAADPYDDEEGTYG